MDIEEINEHIRKLKCEETDWSSVEKLAALCTVRNELEGDKPAVFSEPVMIQEYSQAAAPQSEFVTAASGVAFNGLMQVLNEHMNAIKLVYPKEYELVMSKINNL